jgi:O-succinylhomoserine sulfhydrylase
VTVTGAFPPDATPGGSGRKPLPRGVRPATLAVRGGHQRSEFQETGEALFLTQGYVYDSAAEAEAAFAGDIDRFVYSRYGNPTVHTFEERLRLLEGAEACYATATGMSAIFTSLAAIVKSGSRIVAARALFGSSVVIFEEIFKKWGVHTDYVDGHVLSQWEEALATPAEVVFFETPSNPMQDIVDVRAVVDLAHAAGATVVLDNVFATPLLQKPLELGADVVVYSATKHIDGQGRVLGGAILGSSEYVTGPVQTFIRNTGPSLSPFNAWNLIKGLETLPVRVAAQGAGALTVANALEELPGVGAVPVPRLPPAGQPRAGPDERRRHRRHVRPGGPRGHGCGDGQEADLRIPRRAPGDRHLEQPRRRQVPDHAPRDHHAPQARRRGPDRRRHHGDDGPPLGGPGGHARPDRGPGTGPRLREVELWRDRTLAR